MFVVSRRLASAVGNNLFFKNDSSNAIFYLEHAYLRNEELDTLTLTNESRKIGACSFNLSSTDILVASAFCVHRHFKVVSFYLLNDSTLAVHGERSKSVAISVQRILFMNFIEYFIRHAVSDTGSDVHTGDKILANQEDWEAILTIS